MSEAQWARVVADESGHLRRGAWYRVLKVWDGDILLEVNHRPVPVPRQLVAMQPERPAAWTVVPRPKRSLGLPKSWGGRYAVCPNCQERAPLRGEPKELPCPRCGSAYPVAWDEGYLVRSS